MIWLLHGFLGQGRDWKALAEELRGAGLETVSPDLFAQPPTSHSMWQWADEFVQRVKQTGGDDHALVGYSMGGRLALHALLAAPDVFRRAVIVSSGLGIESSSARDERAASDEQWARRFEQEEWSAVNHAWNSQEVFRDSMAASRQEPDFNRAALALALRQWSPAAGEPLASHLSSIRASVLWIVGERDARYVEEGRRAVRLIPRAELVMMSGAGHRVMLDQPERFNRAVKEFLLPEQ